MFLLLIYRAAHAAASSSLIRLAEAKCLNRPGGEVIVGAKCPNRFGIDEVCLPSAGSNLPDGLVSAGSCAGSTAFRSRSVCCPARLPARPFLLRPLLAGGLHAASRPNAPCRQAARLGPAPGHSPSPSSDPRPPTKSSRGVSIIGGIPVVASMADSKPPPKIDGAQHIVASL